MMSNVMKSLCIIMAITIFASTAAFAEEAVKKCSQCQMELSDANLKYSAELSDEKSPAYFDDISCAVNWRVTLCARDQMDFDSRAFVYDFNSGEKIKMPDAFFVVDSGVETPMSSGVIAFKDKEEAQQYVNENYKGRVIDYNELVSMSF